MEPSNRTDSFFLPVQGSTVAAHVDSLYYLIHYISVFFFVLIVAMMVIFVVKYRRRPGGPKVKQISHNTALEITWSVIPLILLMVIFWWGFRGYMDLVVAPRGAMEIQVTAKKWLWEFEYPNGQKTLNEIHVPIDTPVKLIMSSEDVIHSFFVPDFRVKQDVVPGRYSTVWFQATVLGPHQVFCTEYCGTGHSEMWAKVVVDTPEEFQKFQSASDDGEGMPLAEFGAKLFQSKACSTCHSIDGTTKVGPSLKGVFGKQENLEGGATVKIDENYIRESLMEPQAKVVKGFPPAMPTFKGTLSDRQINALVEYLKSL